ncbi:hypothetical protein [Tenacibaculum sp.]|uniref:hypothetical protein n=1 Tax=Tenacibaculum sp. TaxID=1906242 RepID=UPI003D14EDEF
MRHYSKNLLAKVKIPKFADLPKTDLANVDENIQNWINKGEKNMLQAFCIEDNTKPLGYRFKRCGDLWEYKIEVQKIFKKDIVLRFTRIPETKDHFCPLYFTESEMRIEIICPKSLSSFRITKLGDLKDYIDRLYS